VIRDKAEKETGFSKMMDRKVESNPAPEIKALDRKIVKQEAENRLTGKP